MRGQWSFFMQDRLENRLLVICTTIVVASILLMLIILTAVQAVNDPTVTCAAKRFLPLQLIHFVRLLRWYQCTSVVKLMIKHKTLHQPIEFH